MIMIPLLNSRLFLLSFLLWFEIVFIDFVCSAGSDNSTPTIYYAKNFPFYPINDQWNTCTANDFEEKKCFGGIAALQDFFAQQKQPFILILGGNFANTQEELTIFYDIFTKNEFAYLIHVIDGPRTFNHSLTSFICDKHYASTNRTGQ